MGAYKLEFINNQLNTLILVLLSVSTLIAVADMIGIIPPKIKKHFRRTYVSDTIEVLKEFGVDIDRYKRNNIALDYPIDYSAGSVEDCVKEALSQIVIKKKVAVGKNSPIQIQSYIDLIGYSCCHEYSKFFAQQLCNYLAIATKNKTILHPSFDFVVTPKGGSPILGYEFANLINKPFVLHEDERRFKDTSDDFRQVFNCAVIPPAGSTFLVVNDSLTMGTMVISTIKDLRKYGYGVYDCLLVFELTNVDGRKRLNDQGVNLLSIVKVHQ